jgi:hypothetical protein
MIACSHVVRAESVVVMAAPDTQLDSALRVVMAGRGVAVTVAPRPQGAFRLERAAMAQRTAAQAGADAAVWIDDADVCAVTADGLDFRHAPLPPQAASPRTFAAIATSLLDDMIHPESWPQGVDVNVNVSVSTNEPEPRDAGEEPPSIAAPGVIAASPRVERAHAGQTLLEIGPMLTPISGGVQAALSISLSDAWRLGGSGAINGGFVDGGFVIGVASVEVRHVGVGRKHWDLGPEIGYASDGTDPIAFAGLRIARTWQSPRSAVSLAFTPLVFVSLSNRDDIEDAVVYPPVSRTTFPGLYTSLRWQVPL